MALQDILDVANTADGSTAWGTDMRGAMDTLHGVASPVRVIKPTFSTAQAQAELTAAGTSGERVIFGVGTHSYGALSIPDRAMVEGCGKLTTLEFTGGAATFVVPGNQATLQDVKLLKAGTLREVGSVGVDVSDKTQTRLVNVRIESFETGYKCFDTTNTTFYNRTFDVEIFTCKFGMDYGGTRANDNKHYALKVRVLAGTPGAFGLRCSDVRGLHIFGINVEVAGTNTNNGTGISFDGTCRDCALDGVWVENHNVGVTIAAGAESISFGQSPTVTGNATDLIDNGTNTYAANGNLTGVRWHSDAYPVERAVAGSTTLVRADEQNIVRVTAAGAVTVPPSSSVAFPVGAIVGVYADTTGTVSVAAGSGVTVVSRGSVFNLAGQHAEATLRYRGTNVWVLSGDLA